MSTATHDPTTPVWIRSGLVSYSRSVSGARDLLHNNRTIIHDLTPPLQNRQMSSLPSLGTPAGFELKLITEPINYCTVMLNGVVAVMLPEVAVTVTVQIPGVVPGLPQPPPPPAPLLPPIRMQRAAYRPLDGLLLLVWSGYWLATGSDEATEPLPALLHRTGSDHGRCPAA
jgi:hypothetical protein